MNYNFLTICLISGIAVGLLSCVSPHEQEPHALSGITMANSLGGKKVLFVYGGWEGHHPEACRDLYVPWLQSIGAEVVVSNSLEVYTDSLLMQTIDLIIQTWTLGEINEAQLNGLLNAVRNGTGFAGWHGGIIDAFRNELRYHMMTGGQFLAHPGDILEHSIHISDPDDPVMQGVEDFTIQTEQYYILIDPNVHILATTTFDGEHVPWISGRTIPVIWKHSYGKGRVFVSTIGHRMEDHRVPEFEITVRRGIVWACR